VLLLVLILVLIAFALLVVALLSGSVLSAWLSVAVSVAAAAVLVVDWLQRRAATRAGPDDQAVAPSRALSDVDPVTEVLPLVPPSAAVPAVSAPDDSQQTIVMPVVSSSGQPSGSASRPPGAEGPTTPSGGSSSRPVINEPVDRSGNSSAPDADRTDSAVERTVAVDVSKTPAGAAPEKPAEPGFGTGAAAAATAAPAGGAEQTSALPPAGTSAASRAGGNPPPASPVGDADAGSPDGPAAAGRPDAATSGRVDTPAEPSGDRTADARIGGSDVSDAGTVERDVPDRPGGARPAGSAEQPASGGQAPSSAPGAVGGSAAAPGQAGPAGQAVPTGPGEPSGQNSHDAPAHDAPAHDAPAQDAPDAAAVSDPARAAETAATAVPPGAAPQGGLFDPVVAGAPPADAPAGGHAAAAADLPSGAEPPEEPLDTAAARIVAGLTDEVVVVDEQPRYHVEGCRALLARQEIPLPAREAVELGFTPCGWCTPDATLAARHRADARP